jgi:ABC-2 type transport system ATP-binding protein
MAVSFRGVSKQYRNSLAGVHELTFDVKPGQIFGLLGSNGAGKTTIIRLILDLLRPDVGTIEVLGLDVHRSGRAARCRVGYLPGELSLYEDLNGREMLQTFAAMRGGVPWSQIAVHVERFDADVDRPIRTLSRGNKQKLGVVQALMGDPEVLILDEPTSGLDPLVQLELHRRLRELADAGRTVILSSHVLSEVAAIADRVAVVRGGRIVAIERIDALTANAPHGVEVRLATPVAPDAFAHVGGVREVTVDGCTARMRVTGPMDAFVKALAAHEVVELTVHEPDLEENFLRYYAPSAPGHRQ